MAGQSDDSERYKLLYDLGCAFGARLELDELIPTVVERCRDVLGAEAASVLFLDRASDELYFPYVSEADGEVARSLASMRFPATEGVAGEVLASGEAKRVGDARADPAFYDKVDEATGMETRQILAAPLRSVHGTIGVLEVVNPRDGGSFDDEDLQFLEALAGSVAVAIENARMHGDLKASEEKLRSQVGVLRRDLARRDTVREIVGVSEPMRAVLALMESAADSQLAVLIHGETGTGKELAARAIHQASSRADGPFVAVNVAALAGDILESELFGHVRGAFTGASRDRIGLFEAASGGTILLDEVGELTPSVQVKLLRVLQESEVTPVGSNRARRVDVRVLAATNSDLEKAVGEGRFREDLYYRLSVFPLVLPPLRERSGDVPLLVDHFLSRASELDGKKIAGIAPDVFATLARYQWPGNVRELENEIRRAVALTPAGGVIARTTLSPRILTPNGADIAAAAAPSSQQFSPRGLGPAAEKPTPRGDFAGLREARAAFEGRFIADALKQNGGNVTHTARTLGISRVALQKKLKDLGLR